MPTNNVFNRVNLLRTTRTFPQEDQQLTDELTKMYTEVAGSVNSRTIGIFPVNHPSPNGEVWYLGGSNQKQGGLRQVYMFTSAALTFPHMINISQIWGFVHIYGTYTDGTNWFPIPGQDLEVTPTNIVVSGIAPTSGTVVLEWLSEV